MERLKFLLLSMALITVLTSHGTARRHGHGRKLFSGYDSEELYADVDHDTRGRDRRQGRGFHGQVEAEANIPGFPVKGPPSAPYVFPGQGRGPPGLARDNFPGVGNVHRGGTPPGHQRHGVPSYPGNFNPPPGPLNPYPDNPFLNQAKRQPQLQVQYPNVGGFEQPRLPPQGPFQPNINNVPALEPVTNELPAGDNFKPVAPTTSKTSVNPREFDLLYGSNLRDEENQSKRPVSQTQAEGKSLDVEPSFDTRILLDSVPHCKEGFIFVNNNCRKKV